MALIFVDCEASGPCPGMGVLTEFGAVEFKTRASFHGILFDPCGEVLGEPRDHVEVYERFSSWLGSFGGGRHVFVSDNPAFDWQWINYGFWHAIGSNPFGHSARRISDFYAGLTGSFYRAQEWKRLRVTPHDHNPVHDAMGNAEAFARLLAGER